MTFDQFTDSAFHLWLEQKGCMTLFLLGAPGIGKTSAARDLADRMTEKQRMQNDKAPPALVHVLDLSSMLPEDLMGLPYIETRENGTKVTKYAPQSWLADICNPNAYGVLVFDDLPAATTAVQVATRQAALERRIGDHRIAEGVMIIVTGNRREDKSAATTLPAHFRNSVLTIPLEPDLTRWIRWYNDQKYDNLITQFLTYRPAHFSRLPSDADRHGVFATPRTWAMLGKVLGLAQRQNRLAEYASGLVGAGVTTELVAFDMVKKQLVSPEEVLLNPVGSLPTPKETLAKPDAMIAMVTSLADTTVRLGVGKKQAEVHEQFLVALAHICASCGDEFLATSINTFLQHRGNFPALKAAAIATRNQPNVARMMAALAACFSGNA